MKLVGDGDWFAHGIERIHDAPALDVVADNSGALRPATSVNTHPIDRELAPPGLFAYVMSELAPRGDQTLWESHRFVQALRDAKDQLRVEGQAPGVSRQARTVVEQALQMHEWFEQRFYALRQG